MPFRIYILLMLLFLDWMSVGAQQRSKTEIEEIVLNCKNLLNVHQELSLKEKSSTLLRDVVNTADEESFYIYSSNAKGKESFVIVSGDKRMPSVLGYSDTNSFDSDNIPPALRYWLTAYARQYQGISTVKNSSNVTKVCNYRTEGVSPLLGDNKWGQSYPYNDRCPSVRGQKTLVGCVATAMAQVMKYYSFPASAKGYISYMTGTNRLRIQHDFSNDKFVWDDMLSDYNAGYSEAESDAVATLMYSCGTSVKMDFGLASQGGSAAYQSDLLNGYIENYGYDRDAALVIRNYCSADDWHSLLVKELNAGRPVNYSGYSIRDGGHSFVLDGYKLGSNTYPDYHINWGWNGSCDGYYQIVSLLPHEGDDYAVIDGFNESQQMTIGIKPDDGIDQGEYVLVSSKLNSSLSKVKCGGTLTFNASSLYNCSYNRFVGTVSVCLTDEKDSMIILGVGNKYELKYLEGTGYFSYTCSLPANLSVGKYKARMVYKTADSNEWIPIFSNSYPMIEVTSSEETGPVGEDWAEIGCSEMEILQTEDKYTIAFNVYELINLQQEAFVGTIQLMIADENGFPMFGLGEPLDIPELGYNDYLSEAVRISGVIDRILPDGHYRLYLSAKKRDKNVDSYVVLNTLSTPGMITRELFHNIVVRNGIINIGEKQFEFSPTAIVNVNSHGSSSNDIYDIWGHKMLRDNALKNGIYIKDGTKRMYFLK